MATSTSQLEVGPTVKRALGAQEYDRFIKDTLLKVTPEARYALVAGALLSAICSIAFAIFALYAQSALFCSVFITTTYGAYYYPRRNLDVILAELADRVTQLHLEQVKHKPTEAKPADARDEENEKRIHKSKEAEEKQFQLERVEKEKEGIKKIKEEEYKFLEQLQKTLGMASSSMSYQTEDERISSMKKMILEQIELMKKEISAKRMSETFQPTDLQGKILALQSTATEILARNNSSS